MKKNERQNGQNGQSKQNKQNKKIEPRLDLQIQFFLVCLLEFVVVALLAYLIGLTIEKLLGVTVNVPVFVWAIAVSIVIGGGISVWITKKFFDPVAHLKAAMREVAGGNFKVKVETDSKLRDIRSIYADFNAMVHELSAIETLQTDFISGVSHEFKTPIAAIEGYTQLLQDHTLSDEERDAYVEKILYNTGRLSGLVGNILLLSKINNRTAKLTKNLYRLDEQIRQTIVATENKWGAKDIDFDVDLAEVLWSGHEMLLYHVWSNLLDNAIKFSPRGGTIRMRLRRNEAGVVFTICDEGPGIPAGEAERIFGKFYQSDASHEAEGNGLGLALVKSIVTVHDGSVSVEPGTSLFTVFLPEAGNT